jgi:hypothetical protein
MIGDGALLGGPAKFSLQNAQPRFFWGGGGGWYDIKSGPPIIPSITIPQKKATQKEAPVAFSAVFCCYSAIAHQAPLFLLCLLFYVVQRGMGVLETCYLL